MLSLCRGRALTGFVVTSLLLLSSCFDDDVIVVHDVNADFEFTQNGDTVTFKNLSTHWEKCKWSFEGHGTSYQEHPVVVFQESGTFIIKLEVSNLFGKSEKIDQVVVVQVQNTPPRLTLPEDRTTWHEQTVIVNDIDFAALTGEFYFELSESPGFMEDADAVVTAVGHSGTVYSRNLKMGKFGGVAYLHELRPSTTYYIRARIEWQLPEKHVTIYSDAVDFTTKAFPEPKLSYEKKYINPRITISTGLESFDPDGLVGHETMPYRDPTLKETFWPENYTRNRFSFDLELGETLYFAYRMTYKKYPDVRHTTVIPVECPYKLISLYFQEEQFSYVKLDNGFHIELESDYGHIAIIHLVNKNSLGSYPIEVNYKDNSKNYIAFTSPLYNDTMYAFSNRGQIINRISDSQNRTYELFKANDRVEFLTSDKKVTTMGQLYFRID